MIVLLILIFILTTVLLLKVKELKKVQKSYNDLEKRIQTFTENSPDLIACYDTNAGITYFNSQLEAFVGVSYKDIFGRKITDFDPNKIYDEYQIELERVIATGKTCNMYLTIPFSQSVQVHYVHIVPETDTNGNIIGAITFGRDVTELYQTKKSLEHFNAALEKQVLKRTAELQEREETFRAIVENSPDTISRYNLEMHRIYVNPMMQFLLGKPLNEILGKTPRDFSPLSDIEEFEQMFQTAVHEGKVLECDISFSTPWGQIRHGKQRFIPEFDLDKNVVGIIVIGRETSEYL